jgi:hypothetical protein
MRVRTLSLNDSASNAFLPPVVRQSSLSRTTVSTVSRCSFDASPAALVNDARHVIGKRLAFNSWRIQE